MRKNTPPEPQAVEILEPPAVPISVVTLAGELGEQVDWLIARLGRDDVFVEPSTGLRCVSVATCRRLIDEHLESARRRAKTAADAEAKILASQPKPTRFIPDEKFQEILEAQR